MACGRGSGTAKGMGQGHGKGSGEGGHIKCAIRVMVCAFVLGIIKIIVGLACRKSCPVDSRIPKVIMGTAAADTISDFIVGCTEYNCDGGSKAGLVLLIVEHIISIITAGVYIYPQYSYISGGCDGANECCDQNFIKFALGVTIIDWIFLFIIAVAGLCFLCDDQTRVNRLN